jgi:hypothetical protein
MKIFHTVEKVQKCVAIMTNRNILIIYVGYSLQSEKKGTRKTLCNSYLRTDIESAKRMSKTCDRPMQTH